MKYALHRILVGCALILCGWSVALAQLTVETLTPNGERQVFEVPSTALDGVPHDPRFQGGSPGFVTPTIVSTERVRTEPLIKQPFRVREAPKHKIREDLIPGDSTAAQIFLLEPSDFFPQALDAFRWFDALGFNDLTPPDTNIGVGPDHVVVATNDDFAFYDRYGNQQYRVDVQTFLNTSDFMFDPRVVYDYWNGRFLILYLRMRGNNGANGSWWTLMISDDANPNGNWIIYNFDAKFDGGTSVNQWVDFPHLGFDNEAVYLSGNMYNVSGGFRYGKVRILWKNQIYNAQSAPWYDFWSLPDTIAPAQGYRVLLSPRHHYWAYAPGGGGNFIRVYRIENPLAWHQGSGTPNLVAQANVGVGAFSPPPNAREPGRGRVLWTVDCRITDKSRLNYPFLYTSNHVGANGGQSVACKYYRLNVTNNTAPRDGLLVFNAAFDAFFPTLEATRDEDMALGLNASNDDLGSPYYVSFIVYEWLEGSASIGAGIGLRFGSGVAGGNSTANRWGDYSGSHLDPCDYRTVWLAGQHAQSGSWMTSAHEITMRKTRANLVCANVAGRRGDTVQLSATLTRADNNAGISGAAITFSVNGAQVGAATTNASGVATLNYAIPNVLSPGNHVITAEFNYCPLNIDYSWSRSQCTLRVLLEIPDAGDLPETSQSTPSGALSVIDGILDADDVDMYALFLPNP
ncbi:MAG: Ig-like domain-containing protein, partial [Fimbriimonadales bacterium]|nr:Ig-like domain-containing protein [Fimbriimonadales bacterium]